MIFRKTLRCKHVEITYEYRQNRVLVIFTNFIDSRLSSLADCLHEGCSQIESTEKIIKYDNSLGAIIISMIKGYDENLANLEIEEVFNYLFNEQLCQTTVHT